MNIVSEAGDLVFSEQDVFNFGGVYGEVCIEPGVCYTAVVTGAWDGELEWNDGLFGVNTAFEDLAYAEWPTGEDTWVVQFSLGNICEKAISTWTLTSAAPTVATNYNPDALINDGSCIFDNLCDGMFEVEFVLDGGLMPDEVGLNVSNDEATSSWRWTATLIFSGMCARWMLQVEMLDTFGDGWNGAMAELFVDGSRQAP